MFAALKQAGVPVAVASASIAANSARALLASFGLREHVSGQATTSGGTSWGTFDPNARADDEGVSDVLPPNYKAPSLDE